MIKNNNVRYRPSNKTTIAEIYSITTHTLKKWLKPIENDLGNYICLYTPKQVAIIVKHLGETDKINKIRVSE